MFRQMALGNIRLVFLELPRLSDGDVLGKQVGKVRVLSLHLRLQQGQLCHTSHCVLLIHPTTKDAAEVN